MESQISRGAKTLFAALALVSVLSPQQSALAAAADVALNSNVTVNTTSSSVTSSDASTSSTSSTTLKRPRVALVLGGGGLRGVAHIPVLEAIEQEHIPIDMVVGTSIGAIVGGLYCAGVKPTELRREGVRDFIKDFYTAPISLQLLKIPFALITFRNPQGLYSGGKLGKALDRRVGSNMEISAYKTKFAAVTTDLVEGKSCVITSGDLGVALRASAAVPIYRRPVTIGDLLLVDGGVLSNLPVKQARDLGAQFVIAVNIDEKLIHVDPKVFRHKLGSISSRVVGLILAKSDEMQVKDADFCIHPNVTGIGLLSSKKSDGEKALKAGAEEIEARMPALKLKLKEAGIID